MSHRAIREAICTVLESVPDVGTVRRYERWSTNETRLRDMYGYQPAGGKARIQGWFVRRVSWVNTREAGGLETRITTWQIVGYRSLGDEDASALLWDDILDLVAEAFRDAPTLGQTVAETWIEAEAGIQAQDLGPVLFAGVLCHQARLALRTAEFITGPTEAQT